MKKNKKNNIYKFIFFIFFISYLIIYLTDTMGYYQQQNYKKTSLTKEQIIKFEEDVKNGNKIDINEYLIKNQKKYNNKLCDIVSTLSYNISKIINKGVEYTFKYISNLIE